MDRLKVLRVEKGMSQHRLALEMDLSQASVSKYENGHTEPDIGTINRMAKFFNVSADYLLGNSQVRSNIARSDLSEDELELIINYRRLGQANKAATKAYIAGLRDSRP